MTIKRILLLALALLVVAAGVLVFTFRADLARLDGRHLFSRAGWQLPERVIESLDLAPGAIVADVGSGDGYFTFYLAEAVGAAGTVYAVDVDAEALDELERGASDRGLENVTAVVAEPADPLLPDGSVDLVFVCNAYHHIDGRVPYFDRLRDDLAPGGRVAIVEGRTSGFGALVSPAGHGTSREDLIAEMASAGYRHVEGFDFLPTQSFEVFAPLDR